MTGAAKPSAPRAKRTKATGPTVERPKALGVIFTGESVRGILEGRKTVTRRILPTPPAGTGYVLSGAGDAALCLDEASIAHGVSASTIYVPPTPRSKDHRLPLRFVAGARLWVREGAFLAPPNFGDADLCNCVDDEGRGRIVGYRASMDDDSERCAEDYGVKPTSPLLMPRWASRLSLVVVSVRVERLHAMTDEDVIAEGVQVPTSPSADDPAKVHLLLRTDVLEYLPEGYRELPWEARWAAVRRAYFAAGWNEINRKRARWETNPWVLRVAFTRVGGAAS